MPNNTEKENQEVSETTTKQLVDVLSKTPIEFAKKPVYTIRNNQIIAGLAGTAGLIIFALGLENWISSIRELSSPFILIGLGLVLLIISGLFLKKLG